MKIVKLDRRYSMCRHNDYWLALYFTEGAGTPDHLRAHRIRRTLEEYYGPSHYTMFGNPSPWYSGYKDYGRTEIVYLRDESMLSFLQLTGALDESS
jgi:hypothetical protein